MPGRRAYAPAASPIGDGAPRRERNDEMADDDEATEEIEADDLADEVSRSPRSRSTRKISTTTTIIIDPELESTTTTWWSTMMRSSTTTTTTWSPTRRAQAQEAGRRRGGRRRRTPRRRRRRRRPRQDPQGPDRRRDDDDEDDEEESRRTRRRWRAPAAQAAGRAAVSLVLPARPVERTELPGRRRRLPDLLLTCCPGQIERAACREVALASFVGKFIVDVGVCHEAPARWLGRRAPALRRSRRRGRRSWSCPTRRECRRAG